jgi:hypothetical protein
MKGSPGWVEFTVKSKTDGTVVKKTTLKKQAKPTTVNQLL